MRERTLSETATAERDDAFHGGICAALSVVAVHGQDTIYSEIVALCGGELYEFARRNRDVEAPQILRALGRGGPRCLLGIEEESVDIENLPTAASTLSDHSADANKMGED